MILGLNLDSAFGPWSSKPVALQRICMILGLNLDSVFGSWSFKKKDETNVYKCLQKPLIHDAKLIFEILLFGSWSSKLPVLQEICMILGLNPDSVLGSLSSKHLQTTLFTVYLHDLGIKSRFSRLSETYILRDYGEKILAAVAHPLWEFRVFSAQGWAYKATHWGKC